MVDQLLLRKANNLYICCIIQFARWSSFTNREYLKITFRRLLLKEGGKRSKWEYPFAVAGINVSFMLIQILDLHSGDSNDTTPFF